VQYLSLSTSLLGTKAVSTIILEADNCLVTRTPATT
jgi:hypothetical protein